MAELDRFDEAELHVETTTIMIADVVESVRLIAQGEFTGFAHSRALLSEKALCVTRRYGRAARERLSDGLPIAFAWTTNAFARTHNIQTMTEQPSRLWAPEARIAIRVGIYRATIYRRATYRPASGKFAHRRTGRYGCQFSSPPFTHQGKHHD